MTGSAEAPDASQLEAWERMLDRLEADVIEAEVLVRTLRPGEIAPWTMPKLPGSLPAYLVERARTILERQQAMLEQIPAAMAKVGQQRGLIGRISSASVPRRAAVYVDRSA